MYDIYNYAVNNTSGVSGKSVRESVFEDEELNTKDMLPWFTENFMKANPSKFKLTGF